MPHDVKEVPNAASTTSHPKHSIVLFRDVTPPPEASFSRLSLEHAPPTPLFILADPSCPAASAAPGSVSVVELARAKTPHASWLVRPAAGPGSEFVESCGDVVFVSAVDPLFAALPMITAQSGGDGDGVGSFQPVEQLLVDADNGCHPGLCVPEQLQLVCDVKTAGDTSYYRLNGDKVLDWLGRKIEAVVASGAVRMTEKDAVDLVCAFVGGDWETRLRSSRKTGNETKLGGTTEKGGSGGNVLLTGGINQDEAMQLAHEGFQLSARANVANAALEDRERANIAKGGGAAKAKAKSKSTAKAKPRKTPVTKGAITSFFK